jgi:archaeosine synthase beta-subunit
LQFSIPESPKADLTRWIIAQRPPRAALDPFKPHAFFLEDERSASGEVVQSAGILLTNKECPWRCLMCDLWKNTLAKRVPPEAIPQQIDYALERLGARPPQVKLYNSGSFFDPGAILVEEYGAIAERVGFAGNVVVEAHPRLVGPKALRFRDLLNGRLEVALGLETIHPEVLPRLNKRFELADFARATAFLKGAGVAVRVFLLVQPPFLAPVEAVNWAVKSAQFAFECGADVVSLIPTRGGNGAMERLRASGEFSPPNLSTVEAAVDGALRLGRGRVFADLWDLQQFSDCPACFEPRRDRLKATNLTQVWQDRVACASCSGG